MIKAKIAIGKMHITMEANNMKDIFKWSSTYSQLPKECDSCGSGDIFLNHRSAKGFDYYGIRCRDCGAEGKFGQAKESGALFYKWDTKMEKYVPGNQTQQQGAVDDIPF